MSTPVHGANAMDLARDALFTVGQKAHRLAIAVEQLEARYATVENPNTAYFYAPTELDGTWGRTLDPGWTDHAPERERPARQEAIDATLALRATVDSAIEAVARIEAYTDSDAQSADQKWTTRTIGHLRKLRGAIVRGHGADICPSALPMIRAGVPDGLREHAQHVAQRMEEVKSAILAGAKPRTPTESVSEVLDRLQRAAAAGDHHSLEREPEAARGGEYRPASWFRKGMAARLRKAASKTRKSKRVSTRKIDSVVCYSVADARQWWPDDVPKEA